MAEVVKRECTTAWSVSVDARLGTIFGLKTLLPRVHLAISGRASTQSFPITETPSVPARASLACTRVVACRYGERGL